MFFHAPLLDGQEHTGTLPLGLRIILEINGVLLLCTMHFKDGDMPGTV